jgi:hypothetical protein
VLAESPCRNWDNPACVLEIADIWHLKEGIVFPERTDERNWPSSQYPSYRLRRARYLIENPGKTCIKVKIRKS